MLKTLALTLSLVGAGWALGYHGDTILQRAHEEASAVIQAIASVYSYDPRAAALECVRPGVDLTTCRSHVEAWEKIDGRAAVVRELAPRILDVAAYQVGDDPAAKFMIEGLKKSIETR